MSQRSIFRQESLNKIASPEQLDDYIRVVRPGHWLIIAAASVLIAALCVWGFTGTIPNTLLAPGYVASLRGAFCYVPPEQMPGALVGKPAVIALPGGERVEAAVASVSAVPYSARELAERIGSEWIVEAVLSGGYAYEVALEAQTDLPVELLVGATITVSEIRPIQLMLQE